MDAGLLATALFFATASPTLVTLSTLITAHSEGGTGGCVCCVQSGEAVTAVVEGEGVVQPVGVEVCT